ncbi:MAG TPA: nucleotidyltransferase domain-containing protein [Bacteroidia bacterium]|nr:nucleotidyltransferase domain-containing protein [Bacteroidia bacterium]
MNTKSILQNQLLNEQESTVIDTLLYFDIFHYPLTANEILQFSTGQIKDEKLLQQLLDALVNRKLIYKLRHYYSLENEQRLVHRREEGNRKAEEMMQKAVKYSKLIHQFPFVRSVCISGSLSKGFMDEKGDVDYFIITTPKRLWIARSLLILFKKIVLLNNHKYFCVNYFVDTTHLEIPDKNIFTATELLTLRPMTGKEVHGSLMENNQWALAYLPNYTKRVEVDEERGARPVKCLLEKLLDNRLGDVLDDIFMRLTIKKWQNKFRHFSKEELDTALRSRKYVSKHHPQNFQKLVLEKLSQNRSQFQQQYKATLHG